MKFLSLLSSTLLLVILSLQTSLAQCTDVTATLYRYDNGARVGGGTVLSTATAAIVCKSGQTYELVLTGTAVGSGRFLTWTAAFNSPSAPLAFSGVGNGVGITGSATDNEADIFRFTMGASGGASETINILDAAAVDATGAVECTYTFSAAEVPALAGIITLSNKDFIGGTDNSGNVTGNFNYCEGTASPTFSAACSGGTGATGACNGTISYDWTLTGDPGNVYTQPTATGTGNGTSAGAVFSETDLTIANSLAGGGTFTIDLTMTNSTADATGGFCAADFTETLVVREDPNLGSIVLDGNSINSPEDICIYDNPVISCGYTNPSSSDTYTWYYRLSTGGGYINFPAASATPGSLVTAQNTTGSGATTANELTLSFEDAPYTPGVTTTNLGPGSEYDLRMEVVNEFGCGARQTEPNAITINDRPAVQVYLDDPNVNGGVGSYGPISVCTGTSITLRHLRCDNNIYQQTHMENYNYFNYPSANANTNPNEAPSNYNTPCDGTDPEFFSSLTWTAHYGNGDIVATSNLLAGGNAGNTMTSFDPNNDDRSMTTTSNLNPNNGGTSIDTIFYVLEATGINGCANTDTFEVEVSDVNVIVNSGGNPVDASGATAFACAGSTVELDAVCSNCTNETWNVATASGTFPTPNSNGANGIASTNADGDIMTTEPLAGAVGTYTIYHFTGTNSAGCQVSAFVRVEVSAGPTPNLSVVRACDNQEIIFENTDANAGSYTGITVYDGDPTTGSPNTLASRLNAANDTIWVTGDGTTGTERYWFEIGFPNCDNTVDEQFTINNSPTFTDVTTFGIEPYNNSDSAVCSSENPKFIANAQSNISGNSTLTYTWTPTGNQGTQPNMGTAASAGGGGGFFKWVFNGWFPTLVFVPNPPSEYSFTFNSGLPTQEWTNSTQGVQLDVLVENASGCSIDTSWRFDIVNCGTPEFRKFKTPVGSSTPGTFNTYACRDETVTTSIVIANLDYIASYEWRQRATDTLVLSTDSTFSFQASATQPDTIFTVCTVFRGADATREVLDVFFDTTIISRGLLTMYPEGDNDRTTADSVICLNEVLEASAYCPTCLGQPEYTWNTNPQQVIQPVSVTDRVNALYPASAGLDTVKIELSVTHGEDCLSEINRQLFINPAPAVGLMHAGNPVNLTTPVYLCDGDTVLLELDLSTCGGCQNFAWNNTSTTSSITVSSQGGYYAEVRDTNVCLGVTPTVFVLDALDGANAAAVATPSQVCAGNDVELAVPPCAGCTYEWFDSTGASIATTRIHRVNTPNNYYAEITNPQGCEYSTPLLPVTLGNATIPTIAATTDSICSNQTSTLSTTVIAGASYQWYLDGYIISGATNATYVTNTAGAYSVAVNYPNSCLLESPIYRIYDASFKPNITPSTSTVVCAGSVANLSTDQYPNWTYEWYNNGILLSSTGSIHSATSAGFHYVDVTTDYGCKSRSDSVDVTVSTLPVPNATTNTPTYCPGETADLSVSLCPDCDYQWFNASTGQAITNDSAANYRITSTTFNGSFYAVVSRTQNGITCSVNSDTVTVTPNSLFVPPIISNSAVVCNGRDAILTTTSCLNCSYSWLKDGIPAIGGVDDTVHIVNSISDTGDYQVAVLYPNGCRDTSVIRNIANGSFEAILALDSAGVTPFYPDSVICNGAAQDLRVRHPGSNLPGTYFYTLFLNTTPVTGFSNVTSPNFTGTSQGSHIAQVTDPRGCISLSNEIPLREVNVQPILDARATPDVSSVTARAICTDSGSVYMWVSNCVGCAIQWESGGNPISIANNQPIGPADFNITTDLGGPGAGVYTVTGTLDGCSATSNQVTIIDLVGPTNYAGSEPNTLDTSICDGQSIDLGYMPSGTASSALYSFRWLREDVVNNRIVPVNGASTNQYTASAAGTYFLEVTTDFGCVDTSAAISVLEVAPPTGFQLNLDSLVAAGTGTPLASLGQPIDLNNWVFPGSVRVDSLVAPDSAYFTSAPFSGSLFQNAGLFGPDSSFFNPDDTLSGFHLITFHYSTQGCQFTVSDVLEVLPPASIVVTNANPSSVAYEACVGDDLTITTTNLGFPIHEVYAFDTDDNYFKLGLNSRIINDTVFGANTVYSTTINLSVPGNAYASYLMLVDSVNNDTTYTSFVLIHNTDLSFTGLPSMLCSNGAPLTLFGTPTGGSYYVTDTLGAVIPGITVADTLYPTAFSQAGYQNGSRWVDVYYSFRESFTNGNVCPTDDTVSIRRELRDMSLTGVTFNTIAVSQSRELLTNLVYQTTPYDARPNKSNYNVRFSGSFTSPAGNPTEFLPANAGIGKHALRYYIESGICVNSVEDSIEVVPAPMPLGIPSSICRNDGPYTFVRDVDFPYAAPGPFFVSGVASFNDITHEMRVTSVNTNQAIIINNASPGNESFTYDPSLLVGNQDTLLVEYWFVRAEDTLGVNFDSLSYVIGEIYLPIYVEDPIAVEIVDTIVQPFYCQEDKIHLLAGNPTSNAFGGGLFMLYGGTGQYQNGDTLNSNVINPYDVNHLENAVTTYDLVYILNGLVCQNSDTMQVTISKGLNPSFVTASGATEFCDSDPNEPIITNVTVPDTAIWKIGGIPQSSYNFTPIPLDPGIHLVELEVIDTFGCSVSVTDTFTIHALPTVSVSPGFNAQYCANDPTVDFIVSPSPYCTNYAGAGHILVQEDFNSGVPPTWRTFVNAGKPWAPTGALPQGGTGGAIIADSSNTAASDSWILTDSIHFELGHTYRITYMVRVGDFAASCNSFCDASLNVAMGQVRDPNFITYQLDYQPILSNNQAYVRFVVDHVHTGSGLTTGKYFIGFQNFTPLGGRPIRLDNFMVRDMTIADCSQTGIGYANGSGVHQVVDSLYQFNPLAATAGNFDITYVYTDFRGCQDSVAFNIQLDTAPIVSFTDMRPSYCDNEDTILLTGSPLGGAFTSTIAGNLTDVPFFAPLNPANFPVNYAMTNRGVDTVAYTYTDGNGCSETAYDTVEIVPVLDINVINENILDPGAPGHCTYDPGQIIDVFPQTGSLIDSGVVYGPGVRNGLAGPGTAMFYPDSAVLDMGHTGDATLMYIYTSSTGCLDTTFTVTRVHASPNVSFINLPDSICLNADTVALAIKNSVTTGSMGQITYSLTLPIQSGQYRATDNNGNVVPNFISIFDDLQPAAAAGYSDVNVRYIYEADPTLGSCRDTIYKTVRIDTVPLIRFLDIPPYFCENDSPRVISAQPSYYNGSGYLLIDTVQYNASYTTVIPSLMVGAGPSTATYPVYYTFRDTRGCVGEGFDTFEVRPYPRIVFSPNFQDTFCRSVGRYDLRQGVISPVGGYFTDNLALTSIVDSFYLDLNAVAGPRLLTYHYLDTNTNCYNSDTIRVYVFNGPDLDFATVGGCALSTVDFQSTALNLQSGIDSITNIWWDFEGTGNFVPVNLGTPITIPDTSYQYTASGVYNVTLRVENQGACTQSITKPVIISPYYNLAAADYFEDFNAGAGGWYADQTITTIPASGVWEHVNSAAGTHISHGDGLWVTVPDTIYTADQNAWVYSPCFDFTTSQRPMIAFNIWRDVLQNIDGVVLEWYDRNNNSWELVGDVGEGINWYQSNFILSTPGNQSQVTFPKGWTGRSGGFESARLRLDQFKGQRDIRFRVAFATSPQTVLDTLQNDYEGAAFDDIWIGERTRNVLVEHFNNYNYTNAAGDNSDVIDRSVYNKIFNSNYGLDVVLSQYQTKYTSGSATAPDPVYDANTGDLNSRSTYYSIFESNRVMVDGRTIGTGLSQDLNTYDLDYDMLQFPDFDVRIQTPTYVGNRIYVESTVEALNAKPTDNYTIHTVVIQDSFTINDRGFNMLSVARKMLPTPAGNIMINRLWNVGDSVVTSADWEYDLMLNPTVASFNSSQLEVLVFVQNTRTQEVYQVATTQDLNRYTGTGNIEDDPAAELLNVKVYPNPSSDLFNVAFDEVLDQNYQWQLVDVAGRVLQTGMAEAGIDRFTISADRLTDGAYFFVIRGKNISAHRKLIVIKN